MSVRAAGISGLVILGAHEGFRSRWPRLINEVLDDQ